MPIPIHIDRSRPWLPEALREAAGTVRLRIVFSEPEKKVFRKHKRIPVSRWAERYRYVTMSVLPGRWKNEVTPYLAGIMDAAWFPSVQTTILCKSPQVGGTEAILNCLAYAIDRDPGPALCIYPDELTGKENSQDRIQPMIKGSPRLRGYLTGIDDDSSSLRINLQHMPIYIAWARSAARLANKPIRYLLFDEVDKYVDTAGKKETDPISLGEARTITYRYNRKVWKISTPTTETGNIWKALTTEAQLVFDYWVRCPACGADQKMEFRQIKWPRAAEPGPDGKIHSEDPAAIEAGRLAWYECPHCLAAWNDYERDAAVRAGGWRERVSGLKLFEALRARRPMKIGFHLPSWLSPFVSLSEVAAAFLRGLADINKFKDFHNKHLAEPWKLTVLSGSEETILAARCPLPAQTAPEETLLLTCGVDVQKNGFWFVVKAWAATGTSWTIHYGFLATWAELEKLIFETVYPVADTGRTARIFRVCIDTGGGEKFEDMTMTDETYLWVLRHRGRGGVALWGTKGASSAMPGMLKLGAEVLMTSRGKKLPAGLRVLSVDTTKAKDQFHYRLQLAAGPDTRELPGATFLHAGTGSDYAAQILAEEKQRNEKGHEEWVNVHQRPNHLLDAEILAAACVEMEFPGGGLRLIADAMKAQGQGRRVISSGINREERR
ncbi:MAG TPA: phage terminase large subunit family protein [Syntrophales bacterium]|nr:phage terminase large subunit family protein [Syntrophales bacterium]HNS53344.1 phage terminase large subunit family protein [Syntrophales bacterium]